MHSNSLRNNDGTDGVCSRFKKKAWMCTKNASPGWVKVLRERRKGVARDFSLKETSMLNWV